MNYLAHIYLSYENDQIKIGNFIADFIRGNKYKHLPEQVQKGILLHRKIDSFTDANTIVRKSKRRLHARYGHYDGIIIDILMDHFLAKNWTRFSDIPLVKYEAEFIRLLEENKHILPEKVIAILPYLKMQHWLSSYANLDGISKTLIGVNNRTKGVSKMHQAIDDLKLHYVDFEQDFFLFFKELENYINTLRGEFL